MEEIVKLQPYRVIKKCDKCSYFNMEFTGIMLPTNPPKYKHQCTLVHCVNTANYMKQYPYIKYEEIYEDC